MSKVRIERDENKEPTWQNVAELLDYLQSEHRCRVVVETSLIPKGKGAISVDVVSRRVRGRSDWYTCRYVVGRWPSHRARTMPALLVQLLWQLSDAMHDYDDLPIFRDLMPEAILPPPPTSE